MSEYVDYAEYYDACHGGFVEDIGFYRQYADLAGDPILELACGTGRILLPLAEAGHQVQGVELNENMLAIARQKIITSGLAERVAVLQGDMAAFDLPRKDFGMVFVAFRSFTHLFTQEAQLSCLRCAFAHLRPGGVFLVDVFSPNPATIAAPCVPEYVKRGDVQLPNGHRVVWKDRWVKKDFANQINEAERLFEESDQEGNILRSRRIPLTTRCSFRFELQLLLEKAGFTIEALFGGYDRRPYDGAGEIIFVGRKQR